MVSKAIADQEADLNADYRFAIPAGTFSAPGATSIARLEIGGLPAGLAAQGDVISGRPSQAGESTVTVRAFNSQGGSVQTTFKLRVKAAATPTPAPQPPAAPQLADLMAKLGSFFTYNLPDSVFLDPGSTFTFMSVTGLPEGLQGYGGYIAGTPTREGVFTVNARAGNSKGRITNISFKFTVTAGNLNQPPVANGPIAGQTAEVNKPFGFTVPDNAFSDPDGQVASIALSGLPEGLASSGRVVSGTPTREGAYAVTVTATDNAGATARLTFTLTVTAAAAAATPPPVVSKAIADQEADLNADYRFAIPAGTFSAPGATSIARLEIGGLPAGLAAQGDVISGRPSQAGESTVTVRAFNSQGGSVQTTFKLRVKAAATPTPAPQPPAAPQLADLTAKLGSFFTYNLPDSVFLDPGSTFTFMSVTGLPEGLQGYGGYIAGTPTREGVFTVNARAGNSKGRITNISFKFTVTAGNLNQPPVANGPIAGQTAEVNKPFGFTVPDNAFSDPDGQVASIALSGLPEGLASSGRVVSGTPTREGAYAVTVTATDNAGATARLTFTLTVTAAAAAATPPPVVSKAIADQEADLNADYRFAIPAGTFSAPGATSIARLEIGGLPAGLAAQGDVISGRPSQAGESTVTVRAFNSQGGSVQTTFKLRVKAAATPTPAPQPPAAPQLADLTAKLGVSFTLNIPESTFQDLGLPLNFISVTGLPNGLQNSGGYITGTPTKEGVFTVNVKGGNEAGRVAETSFKFTITTGNLPPIVKGSVPTRTAELNKPYTYTLPDNLFADSDGQITSITLSGLPEGLTSSGQVISGTPTKEGTYTITVTATDNLGASVKLTFTLNVIKENKAPVLTKPVSDLELIMGQVFYFDVASYFSDPDGAISTIYYAATLPPGITANGSVIAGNPTAVGEYVVKVFAKDDLGATIEVTFKIVVKKPELRLFLYQADSEPLKQLREINNADAIPRRTLPSALTMFIESNAEITMVSFDLTGPTNQNMIDDKKPFGLYGDGGSFSPKNGTYKLRIVAYRNGTEVVNRFIQFDIVPGSGRMGVEEFYPLVETELWKPYPNPFNDHIRVQTTPNGDTKLRSVEVYSSEGKVVPLSNSKWRMDQTILNVDLSETASTPGLYLLKITDENGEQKVLRILKDPVK